MSKKNNILMVLESQVDKIVLGVIILISLVLLWMYVIGNPYGAKIRIGGQEISVNPANIDRKVKDDAQRLLADLEQSPQAGARSIYDKTYAAEFAQILKTAVPEIPSDLAVPYPGVGEAAIEADRQYAMPMIPNLTDVQAAVLRGAAQVPVEEVTPGTPYETVETKMTDIDLVTISAHFDLQRLYNNFQLSFAGPGLKSSWKDDRLATPVFAQFELQRREKSADGSFSEWRTVPRAKIDPYKKLIEQLPLQADQMQFGVNIWMSQFQTAEVQLDILQPTPYLFGISRVAWMPPEFLQETFEIMKKEAEQEKREARELLRNTETERRTPERGADRGQARRPTRPAVGGPREMDQIGTQERERVATPRRPVERTLQMVEREMQNAMLKQTVRLDSLRDPVMVWVHDDTVKPGQTYEFRIRIGVFNPVAGKDWFLLDQAAFKDQTVLWSPYAQPVSEVEIPKMVHVFPMDTVKAEDKAVKGVKVEVAKYYMGKWQTHEFDVYPGQTIGYSVEETPKTTALGIDGVTEMRLQTDITGAPTTVDYTSGMTLVDVVSQINWGINLRRTDFDNMLYAEAGTMAQMGIGKANWSTPLKVSYAAVQEEMTQSVQMRDQMDMRGPRMPGGMRDREFIEGPRF
jgi:hypothetical protein